MRALWIGLLIIALAAGLGAWYAVSLRHGPSVPAPVKTGPPPKVPMSATEDGAEVQNGHMDVALSIRAALSRGGAIPGGTRLIRLTVSDDKRCEIELSREFLEANSRGSTGESEAQTALRKALAPFDKVQTLTVIVDGAIFEGAHSGEWDAVAVRGGITGSDDLQ